MTKTEDLSDLTLAQLRAYKAYLVDEIKEKQKITRLIDKEIKKKLTSD
jgi:hypothetical protein